MNDITNSTDTGLYALYKEAMKRIGYYHRQTDILSLMGFAKGALTMAEQDREVVAKATDGKGSLMDFLIEVWQRPSMLAEDERLRRAFEVICREIVGP